MQINIIIPVAILTALCLAVIIIGRKKLLRSVMIALGLAGGLTAAAVVFSPSQQDVNLTGYRITEASVYVDPSLYVDVQDESHIRIDEESYIRYYNNEIAFTVKDGVSEKDVVRKVIDKDKYMIVGKSEETGRYLIRMRDGECGLDRISRIAEELEANSLVESACPSYAVTTVTDDYYPTGDIWDGMYDITPTGTNWGMEAIDAMHAWDYYDLMSSVDIGVLEIDGVERSHSDLKNVLTHVLQGSSTDDHGTHVAGIIGAEFDNGVGINGVCPTAKISFATLDSAKNRSGEISSSYSTVSAFSYCSAYEYLISKKYCGCHVVNMSLGYNAASYAVCVKPQNSSDRSAENAKELLEKMSEPLKETLLKLLENGNEFTICVSAGNSSGSSFVKDSSSSFGYRQYDNKTDKPSQIQPLLVCDAKYNSPLTVITEPEIADRVIVVGAARSDGAGGYVVEKYSCMGSRVDIMAPGGDIQSTVSASPDKYVRDPVAINEDGSTNKYGILSGTSMASPHVAGTAGLIYAIAPDIDGKTVKRIICNTTSGTAQFDLSAYSNGSIGYDGDMVRATHNGMLNAGAVIDTLLHDDLYSKGCYVTVKANVTDEKTGAAVSDVKLTFTTFKKSTDTSGYYTALTDSNGEGSASIFAGKCIITLEKEGFEPVTVEKDFAKGGSYSENFTMKSKYGSGGRSREELHDAFTSYANGTETHFIYDDFDGDGVSEAFGITGNNSTYGYTDVKIYFISPDGKVSSCASDLTIYGDVQNDNGGVLYAGSRKFIVWNMYAGGSGSTALVFGVKDGAVYEPGVSRKYNYFSASRTSSGTFTAEANDFSQGYHEYVTKEFEFHDMTGEFTEK